MTSEDETGSDAKNLKDPHVVFDVPKGTEDFEYENSEDDFSDSESSDDDSGPEEISSREPAGAKNQEADAQAVESDTSSSGSDSESESDSSSDSSFLGQFSARI